MKSIGPRDSPRIGAGGVLAAVQLGLLVLDGPGRVRWLVAIGGLLC